MDKRCTFCGRSGHFASSCDWPRKGNVKLHPEQVVRIRELIDEKEQLQERLAQLTDAALAEQFGVAVQTIGDIRRGYSWPDV